MNDFSLDKNQLHKITSMRKYEDKVKSINALSQVSYLLNFSLLLLNSRLCQIVFILCLISVVIDRKASS
jgi:hypothetical protein